MAKLPYIEFANGFRIPILHEDRNVIAIDKPQGWMLAPVSWQSTGRNLFAALTSSVNAGDFWAKSRNLKFIRFIHRLDADTSGVLLLVKTPGALPAFTELFEDRKVEKIYLAVVHGVPEVAEWKCRLRIAPMPDRPGRMEINNAQGKDSETLFRVIDKRADRALVMCWPLTGRTHQIRLHLAAVGHPVWSDELYGPVPVTASDKTESKLALRAIHLSYRDPFLAEPVHIAAASDAFLKAHGFDPANAALQNRTAPERALEHPKARLEERRRVEKEKRQEERSQRRREAQEGEWESRPARSDWQQDEAFAAQADAAGEARRSPRSFDRRQPAEGRFSARPRRSESGASRFGEARFGRKPFRGPREFADGVGGREARRPGSFARGDRRSGGNRPGSFDRSGGGRPDREGNRFEQDFRRPRRPYGNSREGDAGREPRRRAAGGGPGVFKSSAQYGLKAGFQKSGAFPASSRRPFGAGPKREMLRTGEGKRPFRSQQGERGAGQFRGGKPGWKKKTGPRSFRKF